MKPTEAGMAALQPQPMTPAEVADLVERVRQCELIPVYGGDRRRFTRETSLAANRRKAELRSLS